MKQVQYLILLRGINVGGNNIIKMADLRTCLEKAGFKNVATYIQSGNVLLESVESNKPKLTNKIEKLLSKSFNYKSRLVAVKYSELENIVKKSPKGFGSEPDKFRYDVIFLKVPLTVKEALKSISLKEGVDNIYEGKNVVYFSRLISKAPQSRLGKIASLPVYQNITIRNWNTTTKLFGMMEQRDQE